MAAPRLSLLWAFMGGGLSTAALIALSSSGTEQAAASGVALVGSTQSSMTLPSTSSPREGALVEQAPVQVAQTAPPSAPLVSPNRVAPAHATETDAESETVSGNSVADVLARLDAEYRLRYIPSGTNEGAPSAGREQVALTQSQRAASEVSAPEPAAAKPPAVAVAVALPPRDAPPPSTDARLTATQSPPSSTLTQDVQVAAIDGAQRRVTSQIEQLAALQQISLAQQVSLAQQATVLQYLQLLTLPRAQSTRISVARPGRTRAAKGERIVATQAPSISDTDNPWGFDLPPAVLVR